MKNQHTKKRTLPVIKRRIIIFSSTESLSIAEAIQRSFYHQYYSVTVWTNGFFRTSHSNISNFDNLKYDYDFAIVVCSGDDRMHSRGKNRVALRDNVLLELGICIGKFPLSRVFIVKEQSVKLPSDLAGIEPIEYSIGVGEDMDTVAGTICSKIKATINSSDVSAKYIKLSWDEYFLTMSTIVDTLKQSPSIGGFDYDVAIGINRGGLMAADLISRENGHSIPVIALFANRGNGKPRFSSTGINSYAINALNNGKTNNILLVDSFTRNGESIFAAKDFLEKELHSGKNIKTAVVYVNSKLRDTKGKQLDYVGKFIDLDGKALSLR